MKGQGLKDRRLLPLVAAAAMFVFASAANPQAERRQGELMQVGAVSDRSPAVTLKAVGKEVAPGMFEVDPASVRGKRLIVPRNDQGVRKICIGILKKGECIGILVEF